MNRRFIFVALAVLAVGVLAVLMAQWYFDPDRDASVRITAEEIAAQVRALGGPEPVEAPPLKPIDPGQQLRLGIGSLGLESEDQDGILSDLVLTKLNGAQGLELVERRSLDAALRELDLSLHGLVRASDAVKVGKLIRADWLLLGSPARLNGTEYSVVRMVDARTGIIRDVGAFVLDSPSPIVAARIAEFVRTCRRHAAEARVPVYLALGGFADLSLNNRQAQFPVQLRSYLLSAYQDNAVTLLERELVDALLKEIWLDLAGLTGQTGEDGLAMQTACWVVDGSYQSYEASSYEVELELQIQRMFGKSQKVLLRGAPDDSLFHKVKEAIDESMESNNEPLMLSRMTEARAQMLKGKQLTDLAGVDLLSAPVYQSLDAPAAARQLRNVNEAIRAFQGALLLSPTNREAKLYLAACLRNPSIRRDAEAREIYRELLDENVQDKWVRPAQFALAYSFEWIATDQEKARWFAEASRQSSNSPSAEFYRTNAARAALDAAIEQGGGADVAALAKERLREAVRSTKNFMENKGGASYGAFGMFDFRAAFQGDHQAASRALEEFVPTLQSEFPSLAPHLALSALEFQTDTNSTLVQECRRQLDWCLNHPQELFKPRQFWSVVRHSAYGWLMNQGLPEEAIHYIECRRTAAGLWSEVKFDEHDQMALAYALMGAEQWQMALEAFESFTNQSVTISGDGPWGRAFRPVLISEQIAFCRDKLGLEVTTDAFQEELLKNQVCLHTPSDVLVEEDGLWVAIGAELLHLDLELRTNLVVALPKSPHVPVTRLVAAPGQLWIATAGEGLIEFDRESRQCRHLTEADGLLMNYLTDLSALDGLLWIGYGGDAGGGLACMDLETRKIKSFMPSLETSDVGRASAATPPRTPVRFLNASVAGDIWMQADWEEGSMRHHGVQDSSWALLPPHGGDRVTSIATKGREVIQGTAISLVEVGLVPKSDTSRTNLDNLRTLIITQEELQKLREELNAADSTERIRKTASGHIKPNGGLAAFDPQSRNWRLICAEKRLPRPPTAIVCSDNHIWVGGEGFLTLVDSESNEVVKTWSIPARRVDRIQTGGGHVWAVFDNHLHRAALSSVP